MKALAPIIAVLALAPTAHASGYIDFQVRGTQGTSTSTPPPTSYAPQLILPGQVFSFQAVGITLHQWAAVVATPYGTWPVKPFKIGGHTVSNLSFDADVLAGAIFNPGEFTGGTSYGLHYAWSNADFAGVGIAILYASGAKPIYRPFAEFGIKF